MANTDLGSLDAQLEEELGGEGLAPGPLRRMNLLLYAGLPAFNAATSQWFIVTGTQLDREATPIESRALVLFAAIRYLKGQAIQQAGMAISHTNVAGRTDLSGIPKWSEKRLEDLGGELLTIMTRLTDAAIAGEVVANEMGETKDLVLSRPPFPIWGNGYYPW